MRLRRNIGFLVVACSAVLTSSSAFATTFDQAITVRDGAFTNFINGADARSFDGPGTSPMDAFSGVVNPGQYLEFGEFDAVIGFEAQLLFELTAFANFNRFGLLNDQGGFTDLIIGADVAGSGRSVDVAEGNYRLAVNSPAGLFSSVDADNTDGLAYVIGQRIIQDGKVSLFGKEFNVFAGQYVVFFEDLAGSMPHSDQDFNDGVVLLTVTNRVEVPEPATLSLLLAGICGLTFRRRKN